MSGDYSFLQHPDWKPDFMTEDEWRDTKVLMELNRIWLKKFYGEKCPDYVNSCTCCRLWKAYETIFGDFEQ